MDRGAWWATVHGVAKSQTRLKWLSMHEPIPSVQLCSVPQLCLTLSNPTDCSTQPPCPSPTPGVYSNSCPLSWWCHPTISSSVIPFSSHLQSFPASGSFQMNQFFASGGHSIGVSASASVLMNIQDWSPLGLTSLIFLQPKGLSQRVFSRLSRVFSNTTVFLFKVCFCSLCCC